MHSSEKSPLYLTGVHKFVFAGDLYYDLAKLNHNLTVNHDIICRDLFEVKVSNNVVTCDILRKDNLVKCNEAFAEKVKDMGYNVFIVKELYYFFVDERYRFLVFF